MAKLPIPSANSVNPSSAIEALDRIIGAWKDYKITAEIEETKRENIRAWRDINVTAIEKNTEILKTYLDGIFAERRGTIDQLFCKLDQGIKNGDSELMSGALGAIVSITKESPLKGAQELISSIYNPDVKQIEI